MHIRSLSLRQFRMYSRLELDLPAAPILLLGANAQGKTSLLEAIAYLALGHSPLTHMDRHLIHWNSVQADMPYAHLRADVTHHDHTEEIEIALQHRTLSNGQSRLEKRIRVDQHAIRRAGLAGHLNVVMFMPEDVELVCGAPTGRRRHLDDLLSQVYPVYVEALNKYQSALSRRNALLRHLRGRGGDKRQLAPLEEVLAQTGVTISLHRRRAVGALTFFADRLHQDLTGGTAWLQLQYQPNFDTLKPPALDYQMGLLPQTATESPVDEAALQSAYQAMFESRRRQEVERGMTLVGPHRDELRFISAGMDVGVFGSRGQQRTAVLALRLAELRWLEHVTRESPVLLLDEVLAELDRARRGYLLGLLGEVEQTILATTDAEMFPEEFRKKTTPLQVKGGIVTPL
ncbi:MAG: DNA replication/repair protein RecF [Anaerolineae bacterium]|nr:DNA replication/repair protein RecF [Anaerolineae bacterium]